MLVNYWDAKFLVRDGMNSIVLMCYGAFIGYYGCFFIYLIGWWHRTRKKTRSYNTEIDSMIYHEMTNSYTMATSVDKAMM